MDENGTSFEDFFNRGSWLNFRDEDEDQVLLPPSNVQSSPATSTARDSVVSDPIVDGVSMEKELLPTHVGHEPAPNQEHQHPAPNRPMMPSSDPMDSAQPNEKPNGPAVESTSVPNREQDFDSALQNVSAASLKEVVRSERNVGQYVPGQKIPERALYPGLLGVAQRESYNRPQQGTRHPQMQTQNQNYQSHGSPTPSTSYHYNPNQQPHPVPNSMKPHYPTYLGQKLQNRRPSLTSEQQYLPPIGYPFSGAASGNSPISHPARTGYPWHMSPQRPPMSAHTYISFLQQLRKQVPTRWSSTAVPNRYAAPNKVKFHAHSVPNMKS